MNAEQQYISIPMLNRHGRTGSKPVILLSGVMVTTI
jgi:hypothetical protein